MCALSSCFDITVLLVHVCCMLLLLWKLAWQKRYDVVWTLELTASKCAASFNVQRGFLFSRRLVKKLLKVWMFVFGYKFYQSLVCVVCDEKKCSVLLVDIALQTSGYFVTSTCEENISLVLRIDWIKKSILRQYCAFWVNGLGLKLC